MVPSMNRRKFLIRSMAASASASVLSKPLLASAVDAAAAPRVTLLVVDTDRISIPIDDRIYGQFLEEINHSVVDGLFAEQIRGAGFEGKDFETYWASFGPPGAVRIVEVPFERGARSARLVASRQPAGIRQQRVALESGRTYDGSVWIKIESGGPRMSLRVLAKDGSVLADRPLPARGSAWQEVPFAFASPRTDRDGTV